MLNKECSVLLVEDNKGDARLIQEILRELPGYQLKHTETLSDAVEEIKAGHYHAAIVDLALPDSQGLETPSVIIETYPSLPVIVLTGTDDDVIAYQAIKNGAQDYLVKGSFNHDLLGRTIRHAIERKRNELELKKAKDFAENLIETANALVVGLDVDGKVIIFNKAAEMVTGYKREEVISRNWVELMVPENIKSQVLNAFTNLLKDSKAESFEHKIKTKSGRERSISWQSNCIREQGQTIGTISFGKDITEILDVMINTFII